MSWDLNQVTLIGRLTKDPEIRYSQSGVAVCPLSIAVNRKSMKEGSEDDVYFFDITTFGKTAEVCSQYLSKGKQLGVQGYLRQRRWEDQNGQKRYSVEVIAERVQFLGGTSKPTEGSSNKPSAPKNDFDDNFPDDDIPF